MDSFPEHSSKPASQAEPTIEEIRKWNEDELLMQIQQKRPGLLRDRNLEKFKEAFIDGDTFLDHASDVEFFEAKCHQPIGISARLAKLAREMAGGETTVTERTTKRKDPPHTDIAPPPKRTQVGDSSLIVNGELEYFRSGTKDFSDLLLKEGQAYFDRTRYIFTLHKLDDFILFCRPRRFGKSLTISMLEHFHGLQYADEYQSLYKGLDVQKDIDEKKVNPGQYFVLKFDFSEINPRPGLTEADEELTEFLNSSVKVFYETYAAYLGGSIAELRQNINNDNPNVGLRWCAQSVRKAIKQDDRLAGVKGIYMLVDEYDAFPNNYLEPHETAGGPKIAWDNTAVGRTFKSFWSTIKVLSRDGLIPRIFITGVSPLSLSSLGSAFNVARNLSFHKDLAGLCGLTYSDLKDALKKIHEDPEAYSGALSEMTRFFNGYHFCKVKQVETVYNTETCLAYLQCCIEGMIPEAQDPANSEVSEELLRRFAALTPVIRDLEKALEFDEKEGFTPFEYGRFKPEFTLRDLSEAEDLSLWRSVVVYFGGLTFHPEKPTTHLKIPNSVAADRIALAVLEKYGLRTALEGALLCLVEYGNLEPTLGCYRELMMQRDITTEDLTQTREAAHRDSFYFCLLRKHFVPRARWRVIKPDKIDGRIDLVFQVPRRLIVTEWKFYPINFLDVQVGDRNANLAKADILCNYKLPEILQLRFGTWDKYHRGTIRSWVMENDGPQLRDYMKSTYVQHLMEKQSLELRAHLVIIVGSRHILLWDMEEGNLAAEPRLVELPSRPNRQDVRGHYS